MSEASMQRSVRDWVYGEYGKCTVDLKGKRTGCVRILKLSTLAMYGEAGWMDLCFWVLGGYVFLIEMKKLGKEASEAQEQKARELRSLGFSVYLEDTVEGAKATAKREIDAALERCRASQKSTKAGRSSVDAFVRRQRRRGWTLIETMIAVAILGIVGVTALSLYADHKAHAGMHCTLYREKPPMYFLPGSSGGLAIPIERRECVRWEKDRP